MKVYVASSWRNEQQPAVVGLLRARGHDVYDFRHPSPGNDGFNWRSIDPDWQAWTPEQYTQALQHPVARDGFRVDMDALRAAEAVVLVMPCGRSAHLEAGWAVGAGRRLAILLADGEPELMYSMADAICSTVEDIASMLEYWEDERPSLATT